MTNSTRTVRASARSRESTVTFPQWDSFDEIVQASKDCDEKWKQQLVDALNSLMSFNAIALHHMRMLKTGSDAPGHIDSVPLIMRKMGTYSPEEAEHYVSKREN